MAVPTNSDGDGELESRMKEAVSRARRSFDLGKSASYEQRIGHLRQIQKFITCERQAILDAGSADIGRPQLESEMTLMSSMRSSLDDVISNLSSWMRPLRPERSAAFFFDSCEVEFRSLGVVAVIGSWNYPMAMLLRPLLYVIAAGNTAVLKPSEVAPAMERVLAERLPLYLDPDCYPVVTGGVPETTALLWQRFDHVMFTGSTRVGRIVMAAASKHLTPVTLELGGKNPAIVDNTAHLQNVAQRIANVKALNAGQVCLTVDYIVCTKAVQTRLVTELKKAIALLFGEDMRRSQSYGRIINKHHFSRLRSMLNSTNGSVVVRGGLDEESRFMGISLVTDVTARDALMQEEIFGPILPIVPVDSIADAVSFVSSREKPLAVYAFSSDQPTIDDIIARTSSGQVVVNDAGVQVFSEQTPFGGVGHSGTGAYISKAGFENFSHKRTILQRSPGDEVINTWFRYFPTWRTVWLMDHLVRFYPARYKWHLLGFLLCLLAAWQRYRRRRL